MELSSCSAPTLIIDELLEGWQLIGCGGFGQIYKATHKKWGRDVAIKLLRCNDSSSSSLQHEADLMSHAGNPNVLRIQGVYKGCPPGEATYMQFGLVMEYMERGSLADLQRGLGRPPPWPLTFRIAHQIALGMNFLHQLSPPVLHLDLKPSNVLLDDSLNAMITDFGLSKLARSVSKMAQERDEEMGGTTSYMPPEAFQLSSYSPSFSSDIYSYGILLWSIITGKEPYENAPSSLVRFRIPEGDRPNMESIDCSQVKGLSNLTDLIKRCWDRDPNNRPTFLECVNDTKKVYELHKQEVSGAVYSVVTFLDNKDKGSSGHRSGHVTPPKPMNASLKESQHPLKTEPFPIAETGHMSRSKKTEPPQRTPTKSGASPNPPVRPRPNERPLSTLRQNSSPGAVNVTMCNAYWVQIGNNNYMNINTSQGRQRQRHWTGPANVNVPNSQQPPRYQQNPQNMKP